jgi:hypothetical protein
MHPTVQSQVDAAIAGLRKETSNAAKPLYDDSTKIDFGRGQLTAQISGQNIVESTISDKRPVEGPQLGKDPKSGSPLLSAANPRYTGKAGR